MEPVVADGGRVVLYAPHLTEVAAMHPAIEEIGYHVPDYSWGPEHGERARVKVTLATGIPADVVRRIGLDLMDPAALDLEAARRDPDILLVAEAGEASACDDVERQRFSSRMSRKVTAADSRRDPRQPRRLLKKKNMPVGYP